MTFTRLFPSQGLSSSPAPLLSGLPGARASARRAAAPSITTSSLGGMVAQTHFEVPPVFSLKGVRPSRGCIKFFPQSR